MLDGEPAPLLKKGEHPLIFSPCLLCPDSWMDHDATWYEDRPRPKRHCFIWGPSSHPQKGGTAPNFWSMSIVAKRLHGSRCHLVQR